MPLIYVFTLVGFWISIFDSIYLHDQFKFLRNFSTSIFYSKFYDELSQVVKRRRSKICWSSNDQKPSSFKSLISRNMATAETTSCLSSISSGISSARSQPKSTTSKAEKIKRKRRNSGSNHMRRRAEAILKLLSGGCFPEVNIRLMLGDSPDTSKALRMYTPLLFLLFSTCHHGISSTCLCSVSSLGAQKICLCKIRSYLRSNGLKCI